MFVDASSLSDASSAAERIVHRLLLCEGFQGARLVGQSSDGGADLIAHKAERRWLFQVKKWQSPAGEGVIDRNLQALQTYRAQVPADSPVGGFDSKCSASDKSTCSIRASRFSFGIARRSCSGESAR